MAVVTRRAGEDIAILISLQDAAGAAINIDNLDELYVYVYNSVTGAIIGQWSKAGTGDFDELTKLTATQYEAVIDSDVTKVAAVGIYEIECNMSQNIAGYTDGKNTISVQQIFNLKDSKSRG